MFRNQITIVGGLVRKGELMVSKNQNEYIQFSVAENYSEKQADGSYKELQPFMHNLTLFGKQAQLFAQSDIPLGTRLIITGDLTARTRPSYTDKNGITHPETVERQININGIGPLIDFGKIVTVSKSGTAPAAQTSTATAAPAQAKPVAPAQPVQTPVKDDDDIFGSSSSSNDDDIFADDFDPFS